MVDNRDILATFAENLNKRMEIKGITYRQVAFAAKVSKGSVVHYRLGNCFPKLWTLVLIADYLECGVGELLGYPSMLAIDHKYNATELYTNEDVFMDYFRDRLDQMMRIQHVSPEELADKSGCSVDTIDMYLSIHRWIPQVPDFLNLCDALDCTPSELLGY